VVTPVKRLTLGADVSPIGKEQLGEMAYREMCKFHPNICLGLGWAQMSPEQREPFIAVAVSVRGFHPDA
jgi:hypothetical protein